MKEYMQVVLILSLKIYDRQDQVEVEFFHGKITFRRIMDYCLLL